jgi:hypothetical protein
MAQEKTFVLITLECRVGQAVLFVSGSSNLLDLAIEAIASILCFSNKKNWGKIKLISQCYYEKL